MKKLSVFSIFVTMLLVLVTACASNAYHELAPSPPSLPEGDIEFAEVDVYGETGMANVMDKDIAYIKSVEELSDYYEANPEPLQSLKEDIFENEKYDEEFFKSECLLIYFLQGQPYSSARGKVESVKYKDDTVTLTFVEGIVSDTGMSPLHIVIELDNKYADKAVDIERVSREPEDIDIEFSTAGIYKGTEEMGIIEENITYITSAEELNDYYEANCLIFDNMQADIFQNAKYNDEFFTTKTVLMYYKVCENPYSITSGQVDNVRLENGAVKVNYINAYVADAPRLPVLIAIEIDNIYADYCTDFVFTTEIPE